MKNVLFGLLLLTGCMKAEVGRGPADPAKVAQLKEHCGAISQKGDLTVEVCTEWGEWAYARRPNSKKLYAIMFEKDGQDVVGHCAETVYNYNKAGYGPFDESVPWQTCTDPWLINYVRNKVQ